MEKDKKIEDFTVLAQIYEDTIIDNDIAHFRKIVQETGLDKMYVSSNIDKLFDLCMINGSWERDNKGGWIRCFTICSEAMGIAQNAYERNKALDLTLTK